VTQYRLVRNMPMETLLLGRPEPFAPRYDVEEIDDQRTPVRVIAIGVGAEDARAVIGDVAGMESES
jgi:hypothetical protein